MTRAVSDAQLRSAVEAHWDLGPVVAQVLPGGMNSATWTVTAAEHPGRRWVAKLVRTDQRDGFVLGLEAAARVQRGGIPTGVAEPTRAGTRSVDVPGGVLALLRFVDGRPLERAGEHEQALVGTTLGRAHLALRESEDDVADGRFPAWVDVEAPHLDVEAWVRPAVRAALERWADLLDTSSTPGPGLTWGVLHGDPALDAFLTSPARQGCGLIDWSSALRGPLLYDLASAGLYVGAPTGSAAMVRAYARTGALSADEIACGLDVLLRVRWAVQADYFARRLATDDRTGLRDRSENLTGLHHARDCFRDHP